MKQKLTNEICQKMKNHLSPAQTELLRDTLTHVFTDFGLNDSIEPDMESITEQNEHLIQLFIAAKKIEGCSDNTLKYYTNTLTSICGSFQKSIRDIETNDLRLYLDQRTDSNPALFVSYQTPFNRLSIAGVERFLRNLGERSQVQHVHPHKFRRTMATMAIEKGMPIEQVQKLLGHSKIDTTLHYALVNQSNVKISHRRYIG